MGFATFMASWTGRLIRIVAGLALIVVGLFVVTGTTGLILAVGGAAPLVAGLFNFCLFAPLFGGPLMGNRLGQQH